MIIQLKRTFCEISVRHRGQFCKGLPLLFSHSIQQQTCPHGKKMISHFRSIQTQHSVDWKVSIGGADGADEAVEAAGGADGIFSCGGALG